MAKNKSKIVPTNQEVQLNAAARAALRNEIAVKNLTTGHTVGEAEAAGVEVSHGGTQKDPFPEGTENK